MQLNKKFGFVVPGLGDRILKKIAERGSLTEAAKAVGVTPSHLSNMLRQYTRGCPLDRFLALEEFLQEDLIGPTRKEIVAALRDFADRIEKRQR